eukprot:9885986-Ditylum_brightwellii.AAC.1
MKLEKSLGKWCKIGEELDQKWPLYFDDDDYALYVQTPHGYTKYSRNESAGNIFRYPENTDWFLTSRSVPVKATTQYSVVTQECSWCSRQVLGVTFCQDGTFQTCLDTLPEWESSLLEK